MWIFLIRHAEAADTVPDFARALTPHGREQAARLGEFLSRTKKFQPAAIWHSPLVRARQTADIIAAKTGLGPRLQERSGLTPEDNPEMMARELARQSEPLALVGHEPHLSALGSLLITGTSEPVVVAMKKGATLALERAGSRWVVRWHVDPGLLGT